MSIVYRNVIRVADKFVPHKLRPLWEHPAGQLRLISVFLGCVLGPVGLGSEGSCLTANIVLGPKTVFFWAPMFKWGLVIAGLGDLQRPADKISISQSGSLAATGMIWSRYSLVIIPKNWSLFSVNVFVGLTGIYQCARAYMYQQSLKESQVEDNNEIAPLS